MTTAYRFATDDESGTLTAANWADACRQLDAMFSPAVIADGGWGWIENTDGTRHWVARENMN